MELNLKILDRISLQTLGPCQIAFTAAAFSADAWFLRGWVPGSPSFLFTVEPQLLGNYNLAFTQLTLLSEKEKQ